MITACGTAAEPEAPHTSPAVVATEGVTVPSEPGSPWVDAVAVRELGDGGRIVDVRVPCEALGTEQAVKIYEPPGLPEAGAVPVVYLFHGQNENEKMWQDLGLFTVVESLVASGAVEPLLVVTPDIDNSFGVNNTESEVFDIPDGPSVSYDGNDYEDFLAEDLIAFVDGSYPTITDASGRYVGGISMGGFAALHLAFRRPDLFSRVGAHSPALVTDPEFTWLYPHDMPAEQRNPLLLAAHADLGDLEIRLDVGEQDEWGFFEPTRELATVLTERGASVEFHPAPGGHGFGYWGPNLEAYVRFYAAGLEG